MSRYEARLRTTGPEWCSPYESTDYPPVYYADAWGQMSTFIECVKYGWVTAVGADGPYRHRVPLIEVHLYDTRTAERRVWDILTQQWQTESQRFAAHSPAGG